MKKYPLCVLVLSFALIAGCNGGGSETGGGGGTNLTTTVVFPFNDCTGVSVVGPFSVSIVPGPCSISVTVDSGLHRRLDVREESQLLIVQFDSPDVDSQTMDVVIVMPTLASISLVDATRGTISDFSGSVLEVWLAGVATLEAQNISYDLLLANVDDVSTLLMPDARPLPAADVNVTADSSATVNLMDNAVLTGTATETSTIGYFGSNVSVLVVNDLSSSVTRLGPSRP